jgi:hypothetical protein
MPKKTDKPMDSIFDSTNNGKKADEAAKAVKAKPAPKAANGNGEIIIDKFQVLKTILKTHESEMLYRKTKEDRLFFLGLILVSVVAIGAFLIRATFGTCSSCGWFYSLVFRTFFAVVTGAVGFTLTAMVELNRARLQDLLSMIVKIHESFRLFEEGAYSKDGGAYLPNTYKFIGSLNDDETNYSVLVLKVGAVIAAIAVFLLV